MWRTIVFVCEVLLSVERGVLFSVACCVVEGWSVDERGV